MTDIEKLITSARHYCINNIDFWADKKAEGSSEYKEQYFDNDYDFSARFFVLAAIQQGVETLVGRDLQSFENCKDQLTTIGMTHHSVFTVDNEAEMQLLGESARYDLFLVENNSIEKNAMTEERIKFVEFINTRTTENISQVEPLPYRHRLTDQEMVSVREKLLEIWNYDGYHWNPLMEKCSTETVFLMLDNVTIDDYRQIKNFISANSDKRLYEIGKDRMDYEFELENLEFYFNESIVTDTSFSWIMYGSDECTLTFGGTKLIEFIKSLYNNRQDKLNKLEYN